MNRGELDLVIWVANGLEFHHGVGDGLEWRLTVRNVVQDAPQGPHVTLAVYLKEPKKTTNGLINSKNHDF